MAKKKIQLAVPEREAIYDWDTPGKRVTWLLNLRFKGNRSEMARAIEFSHAAIGQVVSGDKTPGGRMLTAIIEKLGVDAEWLLKGQGEPFGTRPEGPDNSRWMPVSDRLFPDRLPQELNVLSDRTIEVPDIRPSSQYWLRLRNGEPILGEGIHGFVQDDLVLLETDPARFPTEENMREHLCAVKSAPGETPSVKLGSVDFIPGGEEDGPARLEVDTFERLPEDNVREIVVRHHPDGRVEGFERLCRKRLFRGEVRYVPLDQTSMLEPPLRRIDYLDIVAVWTGILYRRNQCSQC